MNESVLKCMLIGLQNANTGQDAQEQIIKRLDEMKINQAGADKPRPNSADMKRTSTPKAATATIPQA